MKPYNHSPFLIGWLVLQKVSISMRHMLTDAWKVKSAVVGLTSQTDLSCTYYIILNMATIIMGKLTFLCIYELLLIPNKENLILSFRDSAPIYKLHACSQDPQKIQEKQAVLVVVFKVTAVYNSCVCNFT